MNTVFAITKEKIKPIDYSPFRVGDKVRVHRRVKEGEKERVQIIEGEIIAHKHGRQPGATITLRRVTLGVAVELVLPLHSPVTEKIQIVKRQKVRRAKLYYLRQTKGKKGRLKENIEKTKVIRELQETRKKEEKKIADKEIEVNQAETQKETPKKEKTEEPAEEKGNTDKKKSNDK